jgi:hypothetical protein
MPILPHNFPTLRRVDPAHHRPSVLTIGAGMSFGIAPTAKKLFDEKHVLAEAELGCTTSAAADDLYKWSDEIMRKLAARGEQLPKLNLAKSLGIPIDHGWFGYVGTQRDTPRHRVVARFAREDLWEQIWSLNWDCIQERALENVGIEREGDDAGLPWPTSFVTFVTASDCAQMAEDNRVKIIKPHGCVTALVDARAAADGGEYPEAQRLADRFLITSTELEGLAPGPGVDATQNFIFQTLGGKLSCHPLISAGWSVSEKYLINYFDAYLRPALSVPGRRLAQDELSIVDIEFNNEGHTRLSGFYNKTQATSHIHVESTAFTTDQLFLWIQALYALGCLHRSAADTERPELGALTNQIQQPPDGNAFIISWADSFLPVWIRLCWRSSLVECRDREQRQISADDINLERRDEHIPWHLPKSGIARPDLVTAGILLASLQRAEHGPEWDFEIFPGGLYCDNRLVIPLPAWHAAPPNDLRGLKALIDAIKRHEPGYIDRVGVLLLGLPDQPISANTGRTLREIVARDLAMARFARGDDIEEITLGDL